MIEIKTAPVIPNDLPGIEKVEVAVG